jgi:hypothetical protein
MKLAEEEI